MNNPILGSLSVALGARFATCFSNLVLEKIFGTILLLIALKMIFGK